MNRMRGRPLGNLERPASRRRRRWRAIATWVAFVALLNNLVLPSALSTVVRLIEPGRDILGVGLCSGWSGTPGKAKPGLLVQHCPLCTVPVASLSRPPRFALPGEVTDKGQLQLRTTGSVASIRHGGMQARAPPSVV